jgi:hypothetical protein
VQYGGSAVDILTNNIDIPIVNHVNSHRGFKVETDSVISNSFVISRRFPKGYIWIDRFTFLFIGVLCVYFLNPYPAEIKQWLIPIILVGLGYGLLFKQRFPIGQKLQSKKEGIEN